MAKTTTLPESGPLVGDIVYFRRDERTDSFQHKRYSDPQVHTSRFIIIECEMTGADGDELMLRPLVAIDGVPESFVSSEKSLLIAPGFPGVRTKREHGEPNTALNVWRNS